MVKRKWTISAAVVVLFGALVSGCGTPSSTIRSTEATASGDEPVFPPADPPVAGAKQLDESQALSNAGEATAKFGEATSRAARMMSYASVAAEFRDPGPGRDVRVDPTRKVWFVTLQGDFVPPTPAGWQDKVPHSTTAYAVVDSYSGMVFERGLY